LVPGVPDRDVVEFIDIEVAVELAVEHSQDVLVEFRRDAGRVVVGGNQYGGVLHQIGAEQQRIAVLKLRPQAGEELGSLGGQQVADGAAEEDHQLRAARVRGARGGGGGGKEP